MMVEPSYIPTLETLSTYCQKNWSEFYKEKMGNPGRNPKEAAALGYKIYCGAKNGPLDFIVLGPNRIREDAELIKNCGAVIGNLAKKDVKNITGEDCYKFQGAVLGEKQWSGLINDLFLIGAVHARKTVYISAPKDYKLDKSTLWNSEKTSLTTMGRELLLLELAGYRKLEVKSSSLSFVGHVFVPPAAAERTHISLDKYREKIKSIKPEEAFSTFQETLPWSGYCQQTC